MKLRVTLEQWRMLQAVVDYDGYAGAAEALSKSVSTVSYGVRRLEAGLGVRLLQVEGRRAVLTRAGRELLRRSRYLLDEAAAIERSAALLARGWEPVVTLAVEVIFPQDRLLASLDAFSRLTGTTRVELIESVLSGTTEQLFSGHRRPGHRGLGAARLSRRAARRWWSSWRLRTRNIRSTLSAGRWPSGTCASTASW
jgi:DNA-binding transcriptional LysR family regulator